MHGDSLVAERERGATHMLWLQWGALLVGLVALLFFAVFTGYYFRNRRMAMEARRRRRA
jgi:type VI protein secretion system component VasK